MTPERRFRLMTYNVRRCQGLDQRARPDRIAEVIRRHQPDVVALQEVDVNRARTNRVDQPRVLGEKTGMTPFFFSRVRDGDENYGIAVLSRLPIQSVKTGNLPYVSAAPPRERTGAMWMRVSVQGRDVQILTTHFRHNRAERATQIETLLGSEWMRHPHFRPPFVFCGDLNTPPFSRVYRRLRKSMGGPDAFLSAPPAAATWPSLFPMVQLDHIFISKDCRVSALQSPYDRLTALASDHLPLIADISIKDSLKEDS